MKKSRSQELLEKFREEWQRSRDWLVPFMQNNQPKFLTKGELRSAAMRELNVSKSAFDFDGAKQDTGRHDWYEPYTNGRAPRAVRLRTAYVSTLPPIGDIARHHWVMDYALALRT
jgi:hypothetical protein